MRRLIFALGGTLTGVIAVLSVHPTQHSAARANGAAPPSRATSAPNVSGAAPTAPAAPPTTSTPPSAGGVRTVAGSAIDTRYGAMQVQVTAQGKRITDVTVLQSPSQDGRDIEIGNYALPILRQEALAAQTANIQLVSGATYTSEGYQQSLQSALDQLG